MPETMEGERKFIQQRSPQKATLTLRSLRRPQVLMHTPLLPNFQHLLLVVCTPTPLESSPLIVSIRPSITFYVPQWLRSAQFASFDKDLESAASCLRFRPNRGLTPGVWADEDAETSADTCILPGVIRECNGGMSVRTPGPFREAGRRARASDRADGPIVVVVWWARFRVSSGTIGGTARKIRIAYRLHPHP
jgi:hypothetical protein